MIQMFRNIWLDSRQPLSDEQLLIKIPGNCLIINAMTKLMWNIPYVIENVWSKSIAERQGLLQDWTADIFTSISLSLSTVPLINCFKMWYLILTLGWGVCEDGWPCFAERFAWPGRSYKQLVFMASLANDIFYCFPVAEGVSKMGFWSVFCFSWSGSLAAGRISSSNWRCGSPQCWGVVENLPRFFWLILGLIFNFFFFSVCLVFIFSIPARLGGHEAKGTKWPHSAILCQRCRSRGSGPVLPQLQEAENPLGDSGSWFPTEKPSLSLARFGTDTRPWLHKGWKWCQFLKQRLCCFIVSSSPLLHFIQCSLTNQISSSPRWAPFKHRHLAVLRNLWCKDVSKFGGHHLGFSVGVVTSHPEPW